MCFTEIMASIHQYHLGCFMGTGLVANKAIVKDVKRRLVPNYNKLKLNMERVHISSDALYDTRKLYCSICYT